MPKTRTFFNCKSNIFCRIIDLSQHVNDVVKTNRVEWQPSDARSVATGFTAVYFLFSFLRSFTLTRSTKFLGTLRFSMIAMFLDVIRFLVFFFLVLFAFAVALTELFWFYGTEQGINLLCNSNRSDVNKLQEICTAIPFSNIGQSLQNLFWSLFGYYDHTLLQFDVNSPGLNLLGNILVGAFHVTVLIVLLNMIIALMTKSFDKSYDKDSDFTFDKTKLFLKYINNEVSITPSFFSTFCFVFDCIHHCPNNAIQPYQPEEEVILTCVNRYKKSSQLNIEDP